ncbi:twin-arginine translocase subunit TatC [Wansuia hejianensis]|uniref:Sec-independent protein translocase protein TatC n=1 Tax=Wansuia hejianensis TaxID=2763667 RepID=A0A926IMH6_9FIRM|nr:twin-arginine translocase subunit TatC [Wansuia hejianensis]MBC8591209.1 twin-arginine translocase subunit TatC [Wansuia hejianensis]
MTKKKTNTDLTLVGHLAELRKRIIIIGLSIIIFSILGYYFAEPIAKDIVGRAPDMDFVFISPSELMLSYLKIAVVCGLVISSPIILSQIWMFTSPGLEDNQKRYILIALFLGSGFFVIGSIFAYLIVLPVIFKFFAGFQMPEIQATISFANYLSFIIRIVLAFGIVFELPILMYVLTRFGIFKVEFFIKYRKYMILIIFVVAAFLTPPDVVSQTLLAVPMLVLYEVGILLSKMGEKSRLK